MKQNLAALGTGLLFGIGLNLSQMVNPDKVLAFLDITGHWDPSLALVMAGALLVSLPAYLFILKRSAPVCATSFDLPQKTQPDTRLLVGASLFGIGWGLAGYCPGPVISALAINWQEAVPFIIAMWLGGLIADRFKKLQ